MIRNNTSFPIQITSKIKELYNAYIQDDKWQNLLKYYQYVVKNIITNPDYLIQDSRGLLLYFTMGIGKTRTAVSISLSMIDKPVIVILPKSLQKNFEDTVEYIEKELGRKLNKKINYVSIDAYNSATQLDRIKSGIDNSLIIIDEAHNFFKSIINGNVESNAYKMYSKIMNAKNIKLLFLTGTPITKDPFELVPCINMLAGTDILPIYYDQFNILYVDGKNKEILNKYYLANRLVGLVSYMTMSDESKNMFPTELPLIVSPVEMSKKQYRKYLQIREKEEINKKSMEIIKSTKTNPMSLPKQVSLSSFYIESRSVSNFVDPIDDEEINDENSPKLALVALRAFNAAGLVMIYSQFVNTHGLKQLTIYLKKHNMIEFNINSDTSDEQTRYAIYTGDTNQKTREKILSIFNSDDNKYGKYIKVLLVSKTGAEGLDLKNVRETHQIEPYWDLSRNNQIKARAVRYGSHLALPESDRTVQPYLYLSVANKEIWTQLKEREPKTIDEVFYERASDKHILNSAFNDLLKDISIECSYFKLRDTCYVCNPSNESLFTNDPLIDINMTNPCVIYSEEEKDAQKILYNNEEYYYTTNPLSIYKYISSLDAYTIIDNNDELYKYVLSQL